MGGGGGGRGRPVLAAPVDQVCRRFLGEPFPPDVTLVGGGHVGEDRVVAERGDGVGVGMGAGARGDAEHAELGVDGAQAPVGAELHPADVVADGLGLPARDRRHHHGQVGLAARAREGRRHVAGLALGVGELEDQHVLGQPAVVAGHHRGDTQGEALLAQESVAAIPRAVGPDLAGLGEMDDVLAVRITGPGHVRLALGERHPHRVDTRHEGTVGSELIERTLAHPGHDPHRRGHVGRVGQLHADVGDGAAEGSHGEGDHVHGAAPHRTPVELSQLESASRPGPASCWSARHPRRARCR